MFVLHIKSKFKEHIGLFDSKEELQSFIHHTMDDADDDSWTYAMRVVELQPNEVVYDITSPINMGKVFYDFVNDRVVVDDV